MRIMSRGFAMFGQLFGRHPTITSGSRVARRRKIHKNRRLRRWKGKRDIDRLSGYPRYSWVVVRLSARVYARRINSQARQERDEIEEGYTGGGGTLEWSHPRMTESETEE